RRGLPGAACRSRERCTPGPSTPAARQVLLVPSAFRPLPRRSRRRLWPPRLVLGPRRCLERPRLGLDQEMAGSRPRLAWPVRRPGGPRKLPLHLPTWFLAAEGRKGCLTLSPEAFFTPEMGGDQFHWVGGDNWRRKASPGPPSPCAGP